MRRFGIEWLALKKHRKIYEDLSEHVSKTLEAVDQLRTGVRCLRDKSYGPMEEIVSKVLRLERETDVIARRAMEDLAVSVLNPVDRGDLMNLVFQAEKVAASAEGFAYRLERARTLEIEVPAQVGERLEEITDTVALTVSTLRDSVKELVSTLEGSACMGNRVSELEEEVDVQQRRLLEILGLAFRGTGDFISYGVLSEIVGSLEAMADDCEDTADLIRILCIKHSAG